MSIDRSQFHICLRQRTLLTAAGVSGVLFAAVPAFALICLLVGCVVAGLCWLVIAVLAIVAVVGLLLGGVALLVGLAGESGEAGCGGFVGLCVGGLCGAALNACQSPLASTADRAMAACVDSAAFVIHDIFVGMGVFAWSWSPLVASLFTAGVVIATVGVLQFEMPIKQCLLRIAYTCPRCSHRGLPHVQCPACDALITDLAPSRYGVWSAHCGNCRAELATSDLLRRHKYPKVCANCSTCLDNRNLGNAQEYTIAIVGAQSSGKSAFMTSVLEDFERRFVRENRLTLGFTNANEEREFRETSRRLRNRKFPAKTVSRGIPAALNVSIRDGDDRSCLLYLYDAAGEDFEDQDTLEDHRFHRFIDGIIFVVDPFAEPAMAASLSDRQRESLRPAAAEACDILDELITFLERRQHIRAGEYFRCPAAVIMTKTDCVGTKRKFSQGMPIATRMRTMRDVHARREYTRTLLLRCGSANFLRTLESRFKPVVYCDWSSLTPSTAGNATKTNPIAWLMELWKPWRS